MHAYRDDESVGGHWFFNPRTKGFEWESYRSLATKAIDLADSIKASGLREGAVVLIVAGSPRFTINAFYTVIAAKAVPLILPALGTFGGVETWRQHLLVVVASLGGSPVLVEDVLEARLALGDEHAFNPLYCPPDLEGLPIELERRCSKYYCFALGDTAFLQMTSGTTGRGKLLAISTANVFANTFGIRKAALLNENEIGVSWLPLYHDMGLVGAELFCFVHDYQLVMLTPQDFVRRPQRWIEVIGDFKCTMAVSANFGLDYCVKSIPDSAVQRYNVSTLKAVFCGSEPIRRRSLFGFVDKFKAAGFNLNMVLPCYGMAETTLACTIRNPRDPVKFLAVNRDTVASGALVDIAALSLDAHNKSVGQNQLELVSVGPTIEGVSIKILDEEGNAMEEGRCGEIVVSGSSVANGYFNTATKLLMAFEDGWVYTGDLGFMHQGELYIVDRLKGIIVCNGINYSCADLEEQAAAIVGAPVDRFAVFEENINPESGKSAVVLLIDGGPGIKEERVKEVLSQLATIYPRLSHVLLGQRRFIPRTTSGKKRYDECRQLLSSGQIETALNEPL